ncbi:alpha-actinin [Conglomerata obtusa]
MQDTQWIVVQTKTFTKWLNTKLPTPITNICLDLKDGIQLCALLQVLSNANIVHSKPAITRFQKIENVNNVILYLTKSNLKLVNIGACDIVDGNEKLILGLIWTIINKFVIMKNDVGNDGLLRWCRAVTAGYDVTINNFGRSWQDGMAFNAIINRFRPDLFDYKNLKRSERMKNLSHAFDIAENELNIPKLLDPEDIAHVVNPDEKSVMTYVSMFHDKFGNLGENSGKKRIENFIFAYEKSRRLENDYELGVNDYINNIKKIENNNAKGKELMKEYKKLILENEEIIGQLRTKKVLLTSFLGTINSINNLYKNGKKEENKILKKKIENELLYCEKCLRDFNIKENEFKEIECEMFCDILGSYKNIEAQMLPLEKLNLETKNKKIKMAVEDKIKFFGNIISKKDIRRILIDAQEMFNNVNEKQNGIILKEEAKEIIKILGVYDESVELKKDYNLDEFMRLVRHLYEESFNITKMKNEFIKQAEDGKYLKTKILNESLNSLNEIVIGEDGEEKIDIRKMFEKMSINK